MKIIKKLKRYFIVRYGSLDPRCSTSTKIAQIQLIQKYKELVHSGMEPNFNETGFRVYSQYEEDGLLLFIFALIGTKNRIFVDIGSGNGINSNCANFAINFGWYGAFIDGNAESIAFGTNYYKKHHNTSLFPPKFLKAFVTRENINEIITNCGIQGEIDLLSIDVDGNDYWIWEAITVIKPSVVIIETHPEFLMDSIVAPYDKDYSYPGKHHMYCGASPVAMTKLAKSKNYRLVGANYYGFNSIYVHNDFRAC